LSRSIVSVAGVQGRLLCNRYKTSSSRDTWTLESMMSTDFGHTWVTARLKGFPQKTHLVLSKHHPMLSSKTSPGVVLATAVKDAQTQAITTVVSRDAGKTWVEVGESCSKASSCSNLFGFALGGGTMVFIQRHGPKYLAYTPDHGASWHSLNLPSGVLRAGMYMDFVATASEQHGETLFLAGQTADKTGVLFRVDFSKLEQRRCFGELEPGEAGSDFEVWRPRSLQHRCFLGHTVEYVRRAVHQPCRVFDHTQTLRKTICKCRNQDYECRAVSEGHTAKCIPPRKLPVTKMTKKELCALGGGAELVGGYELRDGDCCSGGVQLPKSATDCVDFESPSRTVQQMHQKTTHVGNIENVAQRNNRGSPLVENENSRSLHSHFWLYFAICTAVFVGGLMLAILALCCTNNSSHKYHKVRMEDDDPAGNFQSDGPAINTPESLFDDDHNDDNPSKQSNTTVKKNSSMSPHKKSLHTVPTTEEDDESGSSSLLSMADVACEPDSTQIESLL